MSDINDLNDIFSKQKRLIVHLVPSSDYDFLDNLKLQSHVYFYRADELILVLLN